MAAPVQTDASETIRAAVSDLDRSADRARQAVDRAIGQPVPARTAGASEFAAPSAAAPAPSSAVPAAGAEEPTIAGVGRSTTLSDAAQTLADDLMRIPGIQRFGGMRLEELDATGPRPLRTMWRVARDQLDRQYGQMTIGEIIDRYRSGSGGSGGSGGGGATSAGAGA